VRILFAGTAEIGVETLRALAQSFDVGLVLTNADKPQGRSKKLIASPIKVEAINLDIPILQPDRLRGDVLRDVASYNCDVLICFAYGKIFGPKFLSMFKGGCYNIHPSKLPQFRGSSPIQFAILKELKKTAISIQKLSLEVDSGDILSAIDLELSDDETTLSLTKKVAKASAPFAVDTFTKLTKGEIEITPQEGEISFAPQFKKQDATIDWQMSASEISAQIRAFTPWPKASTTYKDKTLFLTGVHSISDETYENPGLVIEKRKKEGLVIACKKGSIIINRLQIQGKKEMDFTSFINGNSEIISSKLG
jgi:methionyl-tRNA formyltransferase